MPPEPAMPLSALPQADLDLLFEFLRFPSVSTKPLHTKDMRACAEWLCALLARGGFKSEVGLPPKKWTT